MWKAADLDTSHGGSSPLRVWSGAKDTAEAAIPREHNHRAMAVGKLLSKSRSGKETGMSEACMLRILCKCTPPDNPTLKGV